MSSLQPEKTERIGCSDVLALTFGGCLIVGLASSIPLLTIIAGFITLREGLVFWGIAIIILGMMALAAPYYALLRAKARD
jgi:amino acid transporter